MTNYEKRSYSEVRADGRRLVGYAAVFESESVPLPFVELIKRGAFTGTLERRDDVVALREHNPEMLLGRLSAGTLTLRQDDKGLFAEITPPDTQAGAEALELVRRGDLKSMSIGFNVLEEGWATRDGKNIREIKEIELGDVSIVAFPAYEETDIAMAMRNRPHDLEIDMGRARERLLALHRNW